MQQFKNDIITESHYNSLVANDTNLQNQITTLSDLVGGGSLSTMSQTLIGGINEIHDGYLPLTGGTITGIVTFNSHAYWKPGTNQVLNATANSQEWSFDMYRNGYTGCQWHVWDSEKGSMLRVTPDNGIVTAPYGFSGNLTGKAESARALALWDNASVTTRYTNGSGGWQPNSGRYIWAQQFFYTGGSSDSADLSFFVLDGTTLNMNIDGYIYNLGGYKQGSDRILKKDINNIENKYNDLLYLIEPKEFRLKKNDKYLKLGFIAQDVENALLNIGIKDMPLVIAPETDEGNYVLEYNQFIPILWKICQIQQKEIDLLKKELK